MRKLLAIALLLLLPLINHGIYLATAWDDKDFFKYCPPSQCSEHGPEIRYPLCLESSNTSSCGCGDRTTRKLACSGQDTILFHPVLGPYNVSAIDYRRSSMKIIPLVDPCLVLKQKLVISRNSSSPQVDVFNDEMPSSDRFFIRSSPTALVHCSREFAPGAADGIVGPVSCLSNTTHFFYLVAGYEDMSLLPLDCKVITVSDNVRGDLIPMYWTCSPLFDPGYFKKQAETFLGSAETEVCWEDYDCRQCERSGRRCAFSSERNEQFCMPGGSRIKVIAATSSVAAFVVLLLTVATVLYLSLKTRYNAEIHLKVEMFLKTYGTSKPTRYTFSQVKKMARRFKEKVGQRGFGSVYKGKLPNGVPVAVKMLENSTGEGEVFINEVATIGLIHHANIVRLLGFCSEGMRRALIYEFMPNESLEKYIFSNDPNIFQNLLVPDKLLDISLGIARGMEYLHQGCNQRILHFDIKPHNILLDYNFNPKISDFGLAKLCARDQSIVTLTAARGTMGYIAPELYSRNFGGVSYKSDVFSFGMLVLEMVSGRRNSDPSVESQNDVYLPEWIYEKVINGEELALTLEATQEEKEKVRQLAMVALWCIQWNPRNRPSMTKVVNMLTGRLQSLQMPPKPFVSYENEPVL
ncbi:rust resistance kinase Lr10-like [Hordeum vulgare subsp. vulgare]|uniref:Protein kinase domain-containing protein n=2 Tax=Hordeum vulgare subsp. vulgare TaxID=112509 RepID=A0A8I6X0R5_HORVV|nr:rust resistance kinase Lr10-like [Hordeum vulgare subsp. vulgare]XP_044963120.1 rust resistance kinase Lr10-like [Hordeum vulgare subsp. vulgare]XP_044963997.1 rust resistance kinase Lr10-like [Hordeum vulgare subsp. vulgare]XP_044964210.1 rust resistance kinase Lr10-like [Hordeum vulgare subsp. vulgare]XP_044964674.1 rust resistance kinase Lr10-like [Hordeum vulgare subsp. vulgare]XP_044964873.1 rust resistance kinase Lr10-like [Hordeum vulgare subsp. vulgare]